MSPYCSKCFAPSQREEHKRCPWDRHLYTLKSCRRCQGELFPRERYCALCGSSAEDAVGHLVLPPAVTLTKLLASFGLDLFSIAVVLSLQFSDWPVSLQMTMALVVMILYRSWARSGGGQSFGQAVFHQGTYRLSAAPLTFLQGLHRTLWELTALWTSPGNGRATIERLERKTGSVEVRLV